MKSKYLWPELKVAVAAGTGTGRIAGEQPCAGADSFPMVMKIESKHTAGSCSKRCGARRQLGGGIGGKGGRKEKKEWEGGLDM